MSGETTIEYLKREIQSLQGVIEHLKSVIAHLEAQGVEIYNSRTPCVFEDTEETRQRRKKEAHPPEIYQKSGEEILEELRETLKQRNNELQNCNAKLVKLEQAKLD